MNTFDQRLRRPLPRLRLGSALEERMTRQDESSPRAIALRIDPAIVTLMAIAFAAAFYRIGAKGLWVDEAFSANYARMNLSGLWHVISGRDPNMGLYYVLLHFWVRVFGPNEAALRSFSAIVGALAIPFAVLLGTRLFGRTAGLVAGLLLALNPFFLQYAQIARSYALAVMLVLASCYAFVLALQSPSRRRLVAYVLTSALSFYAHYFAALVLLAQAATLLAFAPREVVRGRWLVAAVAVIALCIPAGVFASREQASGVEWIGTPSFGDLLRVPSGITGGTGLAILLSALACYGFVQAMRRGRRWQAEFVAAWLFFPVALDFIESRLGHPLFVTHYLIVVLPALLLLAAAGVAALPRKVASIGACCLLIAVSLIYAKAWYDQPSLEGYRGATGYVLSAAQRGDEIVYYPELSLGGPSQGFAYYEFRSHTAGPRPTTLALTSAASAQPRRFWLVIRDSDVPRRRRREIEAGIAARYAAVARETRFRNLTLILYRRRSSSRVS
ncbi:MAG: glycosyltransferase family 39 protein [Solirubrobacteraceae bacterium]